MEGGRLVLRSFSLAELRRLANDPVFTMPGQLLIAPDALPPGFILQAAFQSLERDADPFWNTPQGFLDTATKRLVGSAGFKGDPVNGRAEIGYGVAPSAQRQGVATRGVLLMCEAATARGLRCVLAETDPHNLASQRVLHKAGFVQTGQRQNEDDGLLLLWEKALSS